MPRSPRHSRASQDRLLTLKEAGARVGYAPETLRQLQYRDRDLPKLRKIRGRLMIQLSELDEWATAQGLTLMPIPDGAEISA